MLCPFCRRDTVDFDLASTDKEDNLVITVRCSDCSRMQCIRFINLDGKPVKTVFHDDFEGALVVDTPRRHDR